MMQQVDWGIFNFLANYLERGTDIGKMLDDLADAQEVWSEQMAEAKMSAWASGMDGVHADDAPPGIRKPAIVADVESKAKEIDNWLKEMREKYPKKEKEGSECPF